MNPNRSGDVSLKAKAILALALCAGLNAAESLNGLEELPLPRWTEEAAVVPVVPMSSQLWPEGFSPESSMADGGSGAEGLSSGDAANAAARGDNLLFFIPKTTAKALASPPPSRPAALPPVTEVTAEFLHAAEITEPDAFLLDPKTVLHETQAEDLRRLLSYHAGESKLSAHFLLLDAHERLPASMDLAKLAAGRLTSGHTCLVVYPVGEPWRIRFFMSRDVTQAVTVKYLGEMMNACVQDALQVSDPVEQLQRFATQLSIRLIWLERAHPAVFALQKEPLPIVAEKHAEELLPEVTAEAAFAAAPDTSLVDGWKPYAVAASWCLAGLAGLLGLGLGMFRWIRRRRRQTVWLLPEVEFTARLGGPHCGGGGVSARYH